MLPTYSDVLAAEDRLSSVAMHTPLLKAHKLSTQLDAGIFLKCENLQRTGSFKFRGAYNTLSQLSDVQRKAGVVAISSGNHAQGVAEAGRLLNIPCRIVMPNDAPDVKIARTRASGAEVVFYDRASGDRDKIGQALLSETGGSFVHPYNNAHVIAGQGTAGLEFNRQLEADGHQADIVLVCTGGGGLTAGVVLACKHHAPDAKIYAVEPDGFDDYRRSLESGGMVTNTQTIGSICDAILTSSPGSLSLDICRDHLAGGLSVSDTAALEAIRYAYEEHRIVLEPGGAVALAALTSSALQKEVGDLSGKTIVAMLSGGNVSQNVFQQALL